MKCRIEAKGEGYSFVQPKKYRCSKDSECGNGYCNPVLKRCICDEGYIGRHCEFDFPDLLGKKECVDNRDCTGNSLCWTETNQCLCDPGYYGYRCNLPRNDLILQTADDVKCDHGQIDQDFAYCTCDKGWTGTSCNYNVSKYYYQKSCDLDSNHCWYGICDYKAGTCLCEKGFYGRYCEISREIYGQSCKNHGCENGGICNDFLDICYCPEGFSGRYCELKSGDFKCGKNEDCLYPRGKCEVGVYGASGICRCKNEYYGVKCEADIEHKLKHNPIIKTN